MDYSRGPEVTEPTCPRCHSPLESDEMQVGPEVAPRQFIYAQRFICGTFDDPDSPRYKACEYIQTLRKEST